MICDMFVAREIGLMFFVLVTSRTFLSKGKLNMIKLLLSEW